MTVSSEVNRAGPYLGNGSTTVFGFGFRILSASHLRVIITDEDDVETDLPYPSGYSVAGVGSNAGGSITITPAPATGSRITILRNVPMVQETDLENQGAYYAETIERQFDLVVMQNQQQSEELRRAVKVPAGDPDPDGALSSNLALGILRLYASADNIDAVANGAEAIDTVAATIVQVQTVASEISAVQTVSGAIGEIGTVAGDIANVRTVAGVSDEVSVIATNIDTLLGLSGSILSLLPLSLIGDGASASFNLPVNSTTSNVIVWLNKVRQTPVDDYQVAGDVLTFASVPVSGDDIELLIVTAVTTEAIQDLYDDFLGGVTIQKRNIITTAGQRRYAVDAAGAALSLRTATSAVFGASPFGMLTLGVDYTIDDGALLLSFDPADGELFHVVGFPRASNSEAQVILQEFEDRVRDDADRAAASAAEAAADAVVGSAALVVANRAEGKADDALLAAGVSQEVQARRDFATFYLADYLHPTDLAAALDGRASSQDIDRVTAAVQQFHRDAITAWASRSGNNQRVVLRYISGSIRINDEMLDEATADILWDTGWARRFSKLVLDFQNLHVKAEFSSATAIRTSGFYRENNITYPVRRVVLRLMKNVISSVWLGETLGNLTIECNRDILTDPDGVHICNINDANFFANINVRQSCGAGVIIEAAFNSRFPGVTSGAGWNPTEFGASAGMIPDAVTFSNVGAVVTATAPVFTASHVGRWFALGLSGPIVPGGGTRNSFWAQIQSVNSPTQITLSAVPDQNRTGSRGSFEAMMGTMAAGSNVLTLSAPITGIDLTGYRVTVVGARSEHAIAGHILPATILSHSGSTLTLDTPTQIAVTNAPLVFNASFHMAPTEVTIKGALSLNDMIAVPRLWTEDGGYGSKCGVQAVLSGVHVDIDSGTKIHGCSDGNGNNFGSNFANAVVTRAKGFRFLGTSTHGGFSRRFGKHIFVGNYIDVDWGGESNYYPATTHTADVYLAPIEPTGQEFDFRVYYSAMLGSFGGDGYSSQAFVRGNGGNIVGALRSKASVRPSRVAGGARLPTYLDDTVIDGNLTGNAVQQSATDGTAGRLLTVGAFGGSGASQAPSTTDPDSLRTAGTWRVFDHASMPSTGAYILQVQQRTATQTVQVATRMDPGTEVYIRVGYGTGWRAWEAFSVARSRTTDLRPTVGLLPGMSLFDSNLGHPIWWNGTAWVDATGTTV